MREWLNRVGIELVWGPYDADGRPIRVTRLRLNPSKAARA